MCKYLKHDNHIPYFRHLNDYHFLDCDAAMPLIHAAEQCLEEDTAKRSLNIEVYRKPTHTN